jgi:hypothetical protein
VATEHNWDEHEFVKFMASEYGLVIDKDDSDYVLYAKCLCGKTPLDALLDARILGALPVGSIPEAADGD